LQRYLVRDADGADIFTFGGVAIRSLHSKGTVRVRSRPFPSDKFFGKNMQVVARSSLAMVMGWLKFYSGAGCGLDDSRKA
jgi:hypothetical protein